jgi:hypothetical protein
MTSFEITIEHYDSATDAEHTTKTKCDYVTFEQAMQYAAYEVQKLESIGHEITEVIVEYAFKVVK